MSEPVDYILKFHEDFYPAIRSGFKYSTIRADSKPLKIGDWVYAYFPGINEVILIEIVDHYAKQLTDLNDSEAKSEGYYHSCLLKHELKNIYSDLRDTDYVYYYKFKELTRDPTVSGYLVDFKQEQQNGG